MLLIIKISNIKLAYIKYMHYIYVRSKQLEKLESEKEAILARIEETDKEILNLDSYISFGLALRDNILNGSCRVSLKKGIFRIWYFQTVWCIVGKMMILNLFPRMNSCSYMTQIQ